MGSYSRPTRCGKYEDRETPTRQTLLVPETSVGCDEEIKLVLADIEQFAVIQRGPAALIRRGHIVADQEGS